MRTRGLLACVWLGLAFPSLGRAATALHDDFTTEPPDPGLWYELNVGGGVEGAFDGADAIGGLSHSDFSLESTILDLIYPEGGRAAGDWYIQLSSPNPMCWMKPPGACPYHFGTYSVKLKGRPLQFSSPLLKEDSLAAFFLWAHPVDPPRDDNFNLIEDNPEIDLEFFSGYESCDPWPSDPVHDARMICCENVPYGTAQCPEAPLVFMTVWTDYEAGPPERFWKTTRVVNMWTGRIIQTPPGGEDGYLLERRDEVIDIPEGDPFFITSGYHHFRVIWEPDLVVFQVELKPGWVTLWSFSGWRDNRPLVPGVPMQLNLKSFTPAHRFLPNPSGESTTPGAPIEPPPHTSPPEMLMCVDGVKYTPL
jgi:hypothetical protein